MDQYTTTMISTFLGFWQFCWNAMEQTDGRTDGQTNGRTDGRTNGRTDWWTDGWTDWQMDGWTGGRTHKDSSMDLEMSSLQRLTIFNCEDASSKPGTQNGSIYDHNDFPGRNRRFRRFCSDANGHTDGRTLKLRCEHASKKERYFLDATSHLYKRSRPSVRLSVRPSVHPSVCPVLFSNDVKRHFQSSDDNDTTFINPLITNIKTTNNINIIVQNAWWGSQRRTTMTT